MTQPGKRLIVDRFDAIDVDLAKLRGYCLSQTHPRGRHKARVFQSRLGLVADDAEIMRELLIGAARERQVDIQPTSKDEYGQRYRLDFEITTPRNSTKIRSLWIARTGENILRFTSCYVL
jgi:hypothetical protein